MKQRCINIYRLWLVGLLMVSSSVMAQWNENEQAIDAIPTATMRSVNNCSYMSSGAICSPVVYEVGSDSPYDAAGPRKAPPNTGGKSDYDPKNPQFSPIGDAILPLVLMALAFMGIVYWRTRKSQNQ